MSMLRTFSILSGTVSEISLSYMVQRKTRNPEQHYYYHVLVLSTFLPSCRHVTAVAIFNTVSKVNTRGPSRIGISYAFLGISVGISNLLESWNLLESRNLK